MNLKYCEELFKKLWEANDPYITSIWPKFDDEEFASKLILKKIK